MGERTKLPDLLFEVSWEVCNKVGGIHTVVTTKSFYLDKKFKKNHIHIGPDVWRGTEKNPEFNEDASLFRSWRKAALKEGLRIKVGRWNVEGQPIAILVDYTTLIPRKDEILKELWDHFGVDSISGNWDYIEAALFGYAAGKVIESFASYTARGNDRVVAQFHEWMSGAGLLYLKMSNLPIATVFTTHSTVVGRCLAGKDVRLYDELGTFNADDVARQYGIVSSHSLEKATANRADVFTTLSKITANECRQFLGRECDVITPNGFDNRLTPKDEEFDACVKKARVKLLEVASAMAGVEFDDKSVIVGLSGRYEFKNKGIDVFLDALASLKSRSREGRSIIAFIMVPSGHNGPDKALAEKLSGSKSDYTTHTTHLLMDDYDIITRRMHELGIDNKAGDKVFAFFVPSYLTGNDGIFNMSYYELLAGMDLTVFPSYYEPWGYTPLESLAFRVPTLTTSLAGFGVWVNEGYGKAHPSVAVIERNDSNYQSAVNSVEERIVEIASLSAAQVQEYRDNARDIAGNALWDNNIKYYFEAYDKALGKIDGTRDSYRAFSVDHPKSVKLSSGHPDWARVFISRKLPECLRHLETIAMNLWWCWHQDAIELFQSIDPQLWEQTNGNPLLMLDKIPLPKYHQLEQDSGFIRRLDAVYANFEGYMSQKDDRKGTKVAYFCMEYGIDTSLKIYSGGLGILAGDYLKEASDMKVNMTAVGLLYRYGYFTQRLSAQGDQIADYEPQDFMKIPAVPVRNEDGQWVTISIALPGRTLFARVWKVEVGRTDLYLLDTDFEDNLPEDRQVTYQLYGGDWENRLKQEILLGFGGVRVLRALGIETDVYHCNEGHAAFSLLERMWEYVQKENLQFSEAIEVVRASSLFTTHTPVPAGHDAFSEDLLRVYLPHLPEMMKTDWTGFMSLGKINAGDSSEKFSMSYLAANLSQEVNGVSWLHGIVSQKIFAPMYPGFLPEELHISSVTNGVHYPTWTAPEWKEIHKDVFGEQFKTHHYDKSCFNGIYQVSDDVIWKTRTLLRARLIARVKEMIGDATATSHYSPREIVTIRKTLRDDVLTIGFARRFATYKRAHLLFSNLDRLNEIVNNPDKPVQFLFAGKAHPADGGGQGLIKRIIEISKMPQFIGKIVFVPNYDITIAKLLVQGVDIWMNNPTRPLEASGTSGEKAVMNGVMHFSVLDGWWVEGYKPGAGWALKQERTYDDQAFQDDLDAATIYTIIENEIAPMFYDKGDAGYSPKWIQTIKNTVAQVACNFTTNRMLSDYCDKYYYPLHERFSKLVADGYAEARDIAAWKKKMRREWSHIEIQSFTKPDNSTASLALGTDYNAEMVVAPGDFDPEDLGAELLLAEQNAKGEYHIVETYTFSVAEFKDGIATYRALVVPQIAGSYQVAARIFAKNAKLPHRQDFELVKWL